MKKKKKRGKIRLSINLAPSTPEGCDCTCCEYYSTCYEPCSACEDIISDGPCQHSCSCNHCKQVVNFS